MIVPFKGYTIFAFSDTHGMYRRLSVPSDADILICSGDACEGFNPADLNDFFDWYTSIPAKLRISSPVTTTVSSTRILHGQELCFRTALSVWRTKDWNLTESSSTVSRQGHT